MRCPTCLVNMTCRTEQHDIGNSGKRMDLHCITDSCETHKIAYTPHAGVLAYPMQKWICNSYHLPFKFKDKWYALVGEPNELVGPPGGLYGREYWKWKHTALYIVHSNKPALIQTEFIPLSTDNDFHLEAEKLFNRLIKLGIFS